MTEYGSRAFCLTAALTTFSTAFLMLFFLRYSCECTRDSDQSDENRARVARLATDTASHVHRCRRQPQRRRTHRRQPRQRTSISDIARGPGQGPAPAVMTGAVARARRSSLAWDLDLLPLHRYGILN